MVYLFGDGMCDREGCTNTAFWRDGDTLLCSDCYNELLMERAKKWEKKLHKNDNIKSEVK